MRGVVLVLVLTACAERADNGSGNGEELCPRVVVAVRDPVSGACHDLVGCEVSQAPPDQVPCTTICNALAEDTCIATADCRAAFLLGASGTQSFLGCWSTAPAGPGTAGACAGLDALGCSRRADCIALYRPSSGGTGNVFDHCAAEAAANAG